jgi:membrane AbrB-like protein
VEWPALGATVAVALVGAVCGRLLRLPSPYFLGVLVVGMAAHLGFGVAFDLPPLLLVATYALIGWSIGLSFNREIVRHAARALPQVAGSVLVLLVFCAGVGFVLSRLAGIDFLTAYLATSPGGMDSVAIIAAASSSVDLSFVMAMQMARFLFVLLFGPMIARLLVKTTRND